MSGLRCRDLSLGSIVRCNRVCNSGVALDFSGGDVFVENEGSGQIVDDSFHFIALNIF